MFLFILLCQTSNAQRQLPMDSIPEKVKTSLNQMLAGYLKIEAALMLGNTEDAGKASDELNKLTASVSVVGLSKEQLRIFNKHYAKIIHNTEHIRENSKNYPHQCEHFDYLTDSFYALIKNFKFNTEKIYYNLSPDANEGNSAHWLTDKSTLENPYLKGKNNSRDKQVANF